VLSVICNCPVIVDDAPVNVPLEYKFPQIILLLQVKLPSQIIFPPTYNCFVTPTPPLTTTAPVVLLVASVVFVDVIAPDVVTDAHEIAVVLVTLFVAT
jgi:hypothetical protein